jgi:hypothetical protein
MITITENAWTNSETFWLILIAYTKEPHNRWWKLKLFQIYYYLKFGHLRFHKVVSTKGRNTAILHTIIYLLLSSASIKTFICTFEVGFLSNIQKEKKWLSSTELTKQATQQSNNHFVKFSDAPLSAQVLNPFVDI